MLLQCSPGCAQTQDHPASAPPPSMFWGYRHKLAHPADSAMLFIMVLASRCMVLLSSPLVFVVPALCMLGMARSLVPAAWCPPCEDWPGAVVACGTSGDAH